MAIIKALDTCFYVFYSHVRNHFGRPNVKVVAFVMKHENVNQLEFYLWCLSLELNSEIFEFLPLEFNSNIKEIQCSMPPNETSFKRKISEESERKREKRRKR